MSDTEYLRQILEGIVKNPEEIRIERTVDEMGVLLTLSLAAEDMGRAIGRQGTTMNSIRHLVRCFGKDQKAQINIKLLEPDGREEA